MLTRHLFEEEEEDRLKEIVDRLEGSQYLRRIMDYSFENVYFSLSRSVGARSRGYKEFGETIDIFRDGKLNYLLRAKPAPIISIADVIIIAEPEGYCTELLDDNTCQDIREDMEALSNSDLVMKRDLHPIAVFSKSGKRVYFAGAKSVFFNNEFQGIGDLFLYGTKSGKYDLVGDRYRVNEYAWEFRNQEHHQNTLRILRA